MNKLELLDKQKNLQDKIKAVITAGETEVRKLNDSEEVELRGYEDELKQVETDLEGLEKEERKMEKNSNLLIKNNSNTMSEKRFSVMEAIRNEADRRSHSDEILEVLQAGVRGFSGTGLEYKGQLQIPIEYRGDIVAASNTTVATDKIGLIEPLRGKIVSVQAGAKLMTGLNGNVSMPTMSASSVAWADETGDAADGAGTFGEVTMSPKRLTAYIDVSKQFLNQTSLDAEAVLMDSLTKAIAAKLEATIFGKHTSATNTPNGFFTGSPTFAVTGAADWGKIVSLETTCDTSNALDGKLGYILHPSLRGKMKTAAKATNQAIFLLDPDGKANGYNVFSTTHMASGLQTGGDEYGVIFGNWDDLVIGQWGSLDLTVDPYSQATKGKIRIVINSFWDVAKLRSASFAIGSLK